MAFEALKKYVEENGSLEKIERELKGSPDTEQYEEATEEETGKERVAFEESEISTEANCNATDNTLAAEKAESLGALDKNNEKEDSVDSEQQEHTRNLTPEEEMEEEMYAVMREMFF